jgi:hypothetical protein
MSLKNNKIGREKRKSRRSKRKIMAVLVLAETTVLKEEENVQR